MRMVGLSHRRLGKEISFDRPRILVGDLGKARIGKHREIARTVGPHTLAQRIQELRIAPPADARLRVRGDVRGVEGAERGCQWAAAGVGAPTVLGIGMTVRATSGGGQVLAAGDLIRPGGGSGCRQYGGSSEDPYCNFPRNVSWHALQMLRSLKAASTLTLSPPRSAASSAA